MTAQPVEVELNIHPRKRFELIDVSQLVKEEVGDVFAQFRKSLFCSFHTTAGYLEQDACARLGYGRKQLDPFIRIIQQIFPPNAGYSHDRMELRAELSDSEKEHEPFNADSHLTFMGAGLNNCVTYLNHPDQPVYFIELDGVFKEHCRSRRTRVVAYDREAVVYRHRVPIPVTASRMIDSLNLKDPQYGLFEQIDEWLKEYGIEKGCVDLCLAPEERHVGLTVNEYETMLMRNDLAEVLRDPLRYMVKRGKKLLRNPSSIPEKTRDYAAYDLIHLYNQLMDAVPVGRLFVDRLLSSLSSPASHILRLKRHVSLLVSNGAGSGPGRIVQGTYQSPIMVQHSLADCGARQLDIVIRSFDK